MRSREGRGGRGRGDRGSATVWAGGILSALCVVFAVVLAMGEAVVVRHRAAAAADLAALAAARHWPDGTAAACAPADRVARAQRARLVRCEIAGEVADVVAEAGHGPFTAESRARAGPSAPDPPAGGGAGLPGPAPTVGAEPGPPAVTEAPGPDSSGPDATGPPPASGPDPTRPGVPGPLPPDPDASGPDPPAPDAADPDPPAQGAP